MAGESDFGRRIADARQELDDPGRTRVIGGDGSEPRFELFHAGLSMCSQKVRAVLAEKQLAHTSQELVIVASKGIYSDEFEPAENYRPGYVRLRILGGKELGASYAEGHTGVSSVETEGFDACVVPLLIDHLEERVIADSKRICQHLDDVVDAPIKLIPDDPSMRAAVYEEVDVVDRTPHPGLLYGFHPDDDRRPDFVKGVMSDVHDVKCDSLQAFIDANADDDELVQAYRSKIAKEQAGKALAFDPARQRAVRDQTRQIVANLDDKLAKTKEPWIIGKAYTLADLLWGISLYRLHWLGLADLWSDRPRVKEYAERTYRRPSVWEQVIHFPSPMPPSPHTSDIR